MPRSSTGEEWTETITNSTLLWHISGCDPKIMGIGPAPSSRAALQSAGKQISDMEIVEVS